MNHNSNLNLLKIGQFIQSFGSKLDDLQYELVICNDLAQLKNLQSVIASTCALVLSAKATFSS